MFAAEETTDLTRYRATTTTNRPLLCCCCCNRSHGNSSVDRAGYFTNELVISTESLVIRASSCVQSCKIEGTENLSLNFVYLHSVEIADCNGNTRRLWQTLHGVLGDPVSDDSCDHTADDFTTFFTDKVDSVRASTMSTPPSRIGQRRPWTSGRQ